MPLDFADLGEGIGNATAVLRGNAASAGLDAPVPGRPGWTVRDLVVRQGVVHRRTAAVVRGEAVATAAALQAHAAGVPDLLEWLDDGMVDVLNALAADATDRQAWYFTGTAPARLQAAARRLCHDTTLHAVDAMGARLGRYPVEAELWFSPALARDGVAATLTGAATGRPPDAHAADVVVADPDGDSWTVGLGSTGLTLRAGGSDHPAATLTGPARTLYLALNGRSAAPAVSGDGAVVDELLHRLRAGAGVTA